MYAALSNGYSVRQARGFGVAAQFNHIADALAAIVVM